MQARDVLTLCRIINGAGFHRTLQNQVHPSCALGVPSIGLVGDGELFFEIFKNFALTAFARPDVPGSVKGSAFICQGRHRAFPAAAGFAHQIIATDHRIGHKDFVERRMTVHLCQLTDFHTGLFHIDHEVGETLVFGCIPVCARQQQAVLRVVGAGIPDFLAINDPFVAAQICPGCCTGQIGAAAGFTEELTPLVFTGENAAQVFLLLVVGSVGQQRDAASMRTPLCAAPTP